MPEAMPTEAAQLSVDAERPAAAEEKIQQLEDSVVTLDVRNQYLEVSRTISRVTPANSLSTVCCGHALCQCSPVI